jgi:hypothetical protein
MARNACWTLLLTAFLIPWATQAGAAPHSPRAKQHLGLDARMYGMWTLDTSHSTFGGPYPPPVSGEVNWTASGWAFALRLADGGLYTDAAYTDGGCSLVGVPASTNCTVEAVSPTHVRLIIRDGDRVDRTADIELIDKDIQRAVHRVTPPKGEAYTETTIWKRDKQ